MAFASHLPLTRGIVPPSRSCCRATSRKLRAAQSPPPPPSSRDDEFKASNGSDDWDKAWADFSRTSAQKTGVSGGGRGTFGISEPKSTQSPAANKYRAENRAADAFSSEAFFLGAAIVIGLVAVFYGFVLFGPQQ